MIDCCVGGEQSVSKPSHSWSQVQMRLVSAILVGFVASSANAEPLSIHVWYGTTQEFGVVGHPQRWINVLGHVSPATALSKLEYRLNGSDERRLSFKEDFKRIAKDGNFNVEIDRDDLRLGENSLVIVGTRHDGELFETQVRIEYHSPKRWPLPYRIDWSQTRFISEVAQVVDGKWKLTKDGVRSEESYYDRVIAIGDETWSDYEVATSIIVHRLTAPRKLPNKTGVTHAAIALRWPGHDADGQQPSVKWYPLGATAEFRLGGALQACRWRIFDGKREFYAESGNRRRLEFEQRYNMKHRVETLSDGSSKYRVKLWPDGTREPQTWDLVRTEHGDLRSGSALLIAHHADVTFGNVKVDALDATDP